MKVDYDVIIIGAGPAGSTCAKILIENEIKTLIVEKKKLPRYKACGGLLSKRSLKYINKIFGKIPEELYCQNKENEIMISKNGIKFIPSRQILLKTRRKDLDYWLINQTNAIIQDETYYIGHNINNNIISVKVLKNNKEKVITCRYLVGADGGGSKVRKNIDIKYSSANFLYTIQKLYSGKIDIDKDKYNFVVNDNFSDFFSWFNFEDDNIFIGSTMKIENKKKKYNAFIEHLEKNLNLKLKKYIRQEVCISDVTLTEDRYYFGTGNILLIGEASGLVYRLGEGIPSALISGEIAVYSILESINTNQLAYDIYSEKIKEEKDYSFYSTIN